MVLVRNDEEPYYFRPCLAECPPLGAKAKQVMAAQPGAQGWSDRELKQVEHLLRPHTYPPCGGDVLPKEVDPVRPSGRGVP